jgi:hypothetical protein
MTKSFYAIILIVRINKTNFNCTEICSHFSAIQCGLTSFEQTLGISGEDRVSFMMYESFLFLFVFIIIICWYLFIYDFTWAYLHINAFICTYICRVTLGSGVEYFGQHIFLRKPLKKRISMFNFYFEQLWRLT